MARTSFQREADRTSAELLAREIGVTLCLTAARDRAVEIVGEMVGDALVTEAHGGVVPFEELIGLLRVGTYFGWAPEDPDALMRVLRKRAKAEGLVKRQGRVKRRIKLSPSTSADRFCEAVDQLELEARGEFVSS